MGFDRIFLFFWIILLHTPMGNAISFLFLSKIIPIFQLQRLGGLYLSFSSFLYIYHSTYLSTCTSISLSSYLSLHLSAYTSLFLFLSTFLFFFLLVYLSLHLSMYQGKVNIFKAAVEGVLLYGSECWTLTKEEEHRLDGCYTQLLRHALGISWRDHVTN